MVALLENVSALAEPRSTGMMPLPIFEPRETKLSFSPCALIEASVRKLFS